MSWKAKLLAVFLFATAWSVYHEDHVGHWKWTINIDGIGYNAYLPALLLHDGNLSWDFFETVLKKEPVLENRLQEFRKPTQNGTFVNKYPPGLAVTQIPFWFGAWAVHGFSSSVSGYETAFQVSAFLNNLFWLFLGLWLFSKLLIQKGWNENYVIILSVIFLFGTNLFHFITFDNSLTHPVTLGLSLLGFYFLDAYRSSENVKKLLVFLGILVVLFLLRPINIMMVPLYIVYYLWAETIPKKVKLRDVILGILFGGLAVFLYLGDIKLQTGNWLVYSYQNEKFVFNEIHLDDILFGYRCGMFLYTPIIIMFIVLWFRNENKRLLISYSIGLFAVAYVISTWNEFCYGCRLGNRPMIDYFGFFVAPLIGAKLDFKKQYKYIITLFIVFCLYYNQILSYQYRHYLLDWCDVKKEQFWEVFMRTNRPQSDD